MAGTSDAKTVVLCGVGGQGTILAADLLAHTAMESGYDVKLSEIHGMSQRGGAVNTVVRFGKEPVHAMVADAGCADCVMSFEMTEALRNVSYCKKDGFLLVADESIKPLPVLTGKATMPSNLENRLAEVGAVIIPAGSIAAEVATVKSVNVVLLGALATRLDFPVSAWEDVISKRVPPKTIEANLRAFHAGYDFAKEAK